MSIIIVSVVKLDELDTPAGPGRARGLPVTRSSEHDSESGLTDTIGIWLDPARGPADSE